MASSQPDPSQLDPSQPDPPQPGQSPPGLSFRRRLIRAWGLARSLLIYHGQPWKTGQARRFYAQMIHPGDLCFDIGAHVGGRVRLFTSLGARCVAVEPQPDCVGILQRFFGTRDDVILVPKAIGAEEGQQSLFVEPGNLTVSTLSSDWIEQVGQSEGFDHLAWEEAVSVAVVTLDGLIAQYGMPAFCKIDVEGGELSVLQGLSRPLPLLSLEYIPATVEMSVACIERLRELGTYHYNWATGEGFELAQEAWVSPDAMIAELRQLRPGDDSGDLYARHITP